MAVTNISIARKIFKQVHVHFSELPEFSRLAGEDQSVVARVFKKIRSAMAEWATVTNADVAFKSKALDDLKCAYFTTCQLRLKHLIACIDDQWSSIIEDPTTAEKVFDDFPKTRTVHQDAVAAYAKFKGIPDSEKIDHFEELDSYIEGLLGVVCVVNKGWSDFERARKDAVVTTKTIPKTGMIIGAVAVILCALITGYFTRNQKEKEDVLRNGISANEVSEGVRGLGSPNGGDGKLDTSVLKDGTNRLNNVTNEVRPNGTPYATECE